MRHRRNFARASGHDTPLPILSIGKGYSRGSGNGGANPTPLYREQLLEGQRKRYATNPEYRQKIVEQERQRYARKRNASGKSNRA